MDWSIVAIIAAVLTLAWFAKRAAFVSTEKAQKLLADGAVIIDVRSHDEFRAGNVPGAVNLPLGALRSEITQHAPDLNRPILVHCLSGGRSAIAQRYLKTLGYSHVHNLGSLSRAHKIVGG